MYVYVSPCLPRWSMHVLMPPHCRLTGMLSPPYSPAGCMLRATGGLLYGMFFLLAIHYRIIYSAT